ncbi:unnamed protein product, partial [Rotaria sordida]
MALTEAKIAADDGEDECDRSIVMMNSTAIILSSVDE